MQTVIPISISRVNQFDAARLDIEMSAMLKEQLVKVFSLMKVFAFLFRVEATNCGNIGLEVCSCLLMSSLIFFLFIIFGISQECYFNVSQNLMLSWSFSFGGFPFGLISLLLVLG